MIRAISQTTRHTLTYDKTNYMQISVQCVLCAMRVGVHGYVHKSERACHTPATIATTMTTTTMATKKTITKQKIDVNLNGVYSVCFDKKKQQLKREYRTNLDWQTIGAKYTDVASRSDPNKSTLQIISEIESFYRWSFVSIRWLELLGIARIAAKLAQNYFSVYFNHLPLLVYFRSVVTKNAANFLIENFHHHFSSQNSMLEFIAKYQ